MVSELVGPFCHVCMNLIGHLNVSCWTLLVGHLREAHGKWPCSEWPPVILYSVYIHVYMDFVRCQDTHIHSCFH